MKITRLGHDSSYTLKTADSCYTFFDEFIHHEDMGIELRAHGYVSGAVYFEKVGEFLTAWEERE